MIEGRPELVVAIRPLLEARSAVEQQVSELDRKVMKLVRRDAQVRRFMTVPGVGPITALAFKATIDDPARFARSRSVGAYVGLTVESQEVVLRDSEAADRWFGVQATMRAMPVVVMKPDWQVFGSLV